MTNKTANGTDHEHLRSFEPLYGYIFAGFYILVIIIALFGNLLVCCAIALSAKLRRTPTTTFIFCLAVSDLITAVVAMPFDAEILITSGIWYHSEIMCKAWTVAYLLTVPTSILTLLALSVDRYKTLSDPLNRFRRSRFMTRKRAIIVITVIWLYCFTIAILPVAGVINQQPFVFMNMCYFPMPPLFNTINSSVNFVLPILITCGIYIKIYQIAKLQPLQNFNSSSPTCGTQKMQKDYLRNIRAAKTISMFVCAFMFCWIPYSTVSIVSNLCSLECFRSIPPHIYPPLLLLGYLNSALNPFLFSFRNRAFRGTCARLIAVFKRKKSTQSTSRSINSSAKRSELPDTDSNSTVYGFSIKSISEEQTTRTTNESPHPDIIQAKNDFHDVTGSKDRLYDHDELLQKSLARTTNDSLNSDMASSHNNDSTQF